VKKSGSGDPMSLTKPLGVTVSNIFDCLIDLVGADTIVLPDEVDLTNSNQEPELQKTQIQVTHSQPQVHKNTHKHVQVPQPKANDKIHNTKPNTKSPQVFENQIQKVSENEIQNVSSFSGNFPKQKTTFSESVFENHNTKSSLLVESDWTNSTDSPIKENTKMQYLLY